MIEKWREGETITAAKLNKVSKSILDSIQAGAGIALRRQAGGITISNTQKRAGKSESSESPIVVVKITADIPDDTNEHYQKGWYLGKLQKLSSDGTEWKNESDTEVLVVFNVHYMDIPAIGLLDGIHIAYVTNKTYEINNVAYSVYHVFVNLPGRVIFPVRDYFNVCD